MSDWQPIETAPRGNVRVLVCKRKEKDRLVSHPLIVAHSRDGLAWWSEPGMYQTYPTHWMSLPELPK